MKIILTGASGLVGRAVDAHLTALGHELVRLSRRSNKQKGWAVWRPALGAPAPELFEGADAVVHLAGESVAQRWNYAVKRRIRTSRIEATRALVDSIGRCMHPPKVLVSASAVGLYGDRGDEELTEASSAGAGFLAQVCTDWERELDAARNAGVRTVALRISTVLARDGGALQKMLPPFRLGLGGPIAGGKAWMSWIHIADLVRMIEWALTNNTVEGAVNACAPQPVTNAEFTRALGAALHRPTVCPVPALVLKLVYGEMAQIVLASLRVRPEKAVRLGFRFEYAEIGEAVGGLVG